MWAALGQLEKLSSRCRSGFRGCCKTASKFWAKNLLQNQLLRIAAKAAPTPQTALVKPPFIFKLIPCQNVGYLYPLIRVVGIVEAGSSMKTKFLAMFCASLAAPYAFADDDASTHRSSHRGVSYSYVQADYLKHDLSLARQDTEPDGYNLELSLALGDHLFAVVDRRKAEGTFDGFDFDFDTQGYGFGFHGRKWYASYTYNTWDLGSDEFDIDTLRFGIRNQLTEHIELNASYAWNDVEGADDDDGFQVGLVFKVADHVSLTTEYETIGGDLDIDSWTAGLRISF